MHGNRFGLAGVAQGVNGSLCSVGTRGKGSFDIGTSAGSAGPTQPFKPYGKDAIALPVGWAGTCKGIGQKWTRRDIHFSITTDEDKNASFVFQADDSCECLNIGHEVNPHCLGCSDGTAQQAIGATPRDAMVTLMTSLFGIKAPAVPPWTTHIFGIRDSAYLQYFACWAS
jgi:hypothetical protein